jgi:DNA-binding Lrp family transcriptional regulator
MLNLLEFETLKKFVDTVGKEIEIYFGKENACILCLRPEGIFYGEALLAWLKKRKKTNVTIAMMEDDGVDLDEKVARGRKVLIVNNDIVTGKSYKRSMEALRMRKKDWDIKDIKFACFFDRTGMADFAVARYSAEAIWSLEEVDAIDSKIIQYLSQNGRESFTEVAKKLRLSSVAVKNRVDKLLKEKIIRIYASLQADQFYTIAAQINIEADGKTIEKLIEKFEKNQEVYHLAKITGSYNLTVGVLARSLENIESFVESEIRALPGVREAVVSTGEVPILPKTIPPKF